MSKLKKVLITPKMASKLLETRTQKSSMNMDTLKALEDDIREGNWDESEVPKGAEVVIKNGELVNGRHRCTAVKLTGKPTKMWVRKVGKK